jgi:hypothetical protein
MGDARIFLLKKEPHCCLEQRMKGALILNYLGKEKEKLRIGGKESF